MAMKNNYRQFLIYDLEVCARKDGAVVPDMPALAAVWSDMAAAGRTYEVMAGEGVMLLGGVEVNRRRDVVTLLVRLSNKSAPNSVYSDPRAGHFNEHVKVGNQGADFGCHVLISLSPEAAQPNVYTCAVEKITGLSADYVRRLLSKLLNFEFNANAASFQYPHPGGGQDRNGVARVDRCCPHIEMRARPSDAFTADLNNGRLTGVTLVHAEAVQPIGGAAYLVKNRSELMLSIDHRNLPANVWNGLRNAFRRHAAQYQTAKMTFQLPGSKRQVSVEVDAATGAMLSDGYIKNFELNNINPFLAQSAQAIVPHLRDLAVPQLLANRSV